MISKRKVDVGDGRGFGQSIALQGKDAKFLLERSGEIVGKLFRTGDDKLERLELLGLDPSHVSAKEGRGGEEEIDLMLADEFGEALCLEGLG